MKLMLIGGGFIIIAAVLIFYFFFFSRSCNPPLPREMMRVGSASFNVEVASTMAEQACGLSGRSGLQESEGMVFPFGSAGTQSFWMKDMRFSIDMIWIGGGKVVGFAENAAAQPGASLWKLKIYASPKTTDTVLEVPAGTVAKNNIKVGDVVTIGG